MRPAYPAMQEPQTRITPPLRRTPPSQERGHPPSSSRGKEQAPRFRCHLRMFRRLNSARPTESPQPSDSGTSSWSPPGAIKPRLFPGRSPRQSSANAAPGRFDACPHRADAGGPTVLHLSHSSAYLGVLYTTPPSASVTHTPSFPFSCRLSGAFHGHHRRPLGTRRRRSHPQTTRAQSQQRLRRLLAIPPRPRTTTRPRSPLPQPRHPTSSMTSSLQKSRTRARLSAC